MIHIIPQNQTYIRVLAPFNIRKKLSEQFSFYVPGYTHMPKFNDGKWDGKIRLYNSKTGAIYRGLLNKVIDWLEQNNHEYKVDKGLDTTITIADSEFVKFLDDIQSVHALRDYQIKGLHNAIKNHRQTFLSATGSGKSVLIYSLARYLPGPTLIIVPRVALTKQLLSDFHDYDPNWDIDSNVQIITGGNTKEITKPIVIATWQSIYKEPIEWFLPWMMIIGDEVHRFKANGLKGIMEKAVDTPLRFGFTGTLTDTVTNNMVIEGLFGPVKTLSKTKDLVERNYLAKPKIIGLMLQHNYRVNLPFKYTYQDEKLFLTTSTIRNQYITDLVKQTNGNTLVLFEWIDNHGNLLVDMFNKQLKKKKIFYIHGGVDTNDREHIRILINNIDNGVILASYGVFSEGINAPKINNIIMASPSKAKIRVLQSIGRGLRRTEDKKECKIYDIADNLFTKRRVNYTLEHYQTRIKFYIQEEFDFKEHKIRLEG